MKNLNVRVFIGILVVVSVLVGTAILLITGSQNMGIWIALKHLPTIVSVDLVIWLIFARWGWKLSIFRNWLVPFPCLEGTWEGIVKPTPAENVSDANSSPIPIILVIEQSFVTISCTMYTSESKSQSHSAQFLIKPESKMKMLVYTYTSVPNIAVRDTSAIHYGSAILDIVMSPKRKLIGEYWTTRKSTGGLELKFKTQQLLPGLPLV